MNVGFFNVYRNTRQFDHTMNLVLADMLIRSVRKAMPSVPITQFTDRQSPAIVGVDDVRRLDSTEKMAVQCVTHYAACEGDWLLVDTDVVIREDVQSVFDDLFDVAVTNRDGTLVDGEEDMAMMQAMPHNIGVVFSRCPAFWVAVNEKLKTMEEKKQQWMGNQYAACELIKEGTFNVKILPGVQYNYAAHTKLDSCDRASIVHYKGRFRKKMMLDRFHEV